MMKTLKNTFTQFICAALLLLAGVIVGCEQKTIVEYVPTAEELRVMSSQRIDSAAVRALTADSTMMAMLHDGDSVAVTELLGSLSAEAWILVEDSTGLLITSKNADKRMAPASLTKMMTCMLALENGEMGDTIEITNDVYLSKDSRVKLGDRYLLGDIISEMMLQSDNDAANAIAKHIGGGIGDFCKLMNKKATYLGMDSTHFSNPNGLTADSTFSSAHDLLVLARYCMRDSAFAATAGTAFRDIPLLDGRHLPCENTNLLLGPRIESGMPDMGISPYEGCIGVKTGYTRQAGGCLASAARRNGVTLFLILLNSKSHASRFNESVILLDYGFTLLRK